MLSVVEALHQVLEQARPKSAEQVLLADVLGLVLAEDMASDVDSPPHDKSVVDGYAVRGADLVNGRAELHVLEEIIAGAVPTQVVKPAHCSRIMTGAPVPEGADSIVMVERTKLAATCVEIDDERFSIGQNVMRKAASLRKGEVVLRAGAELGPAEIGLLAEVGRANVSVVGPVRVAALATGNELVPHNQTPSVGQIRNSNGPMLTAAVRRVGATPVDLGIARDNASDLRALITEGLKHDVLVLSGGVSAGVLDLVPAVLAELRVEQVFHKIRLKPGKPLWFGVWNDMGSENRCLVFGLPGNPVSSFVCFELFVKPAIARLAGRPWTPPHPTRSAKLSTAFQQRGDRATYHPAVLTSSGDGLLVEPIAWKGSADLRGFMGANALAVFPPGERSYAIGETVEVLPL